jgi:hypothetical protein
VLGPRVHRRRLRRPRVDRCLPPEPVPLAGCGLTAEGVLEALELGLQALLDLNGALGEGLQDLRFDRRELGDPVDRCPPPHTEAAGHLGVQGGVVHRGEGLLVELDQPGVQRQPLPGLGADLGDHDGVGVQLRVVRPAGVLPERRDCHAVGVHRHDLAAVSDASGRVPVDEVDDRGDSSVLGGFDLALHVGLPHAPEDREALRCGEGHVVPADRVVAVAATAQDGARRVEPVEEGLEGVGVDVAVEAGQGSTATEPLSGRLELLVVIVPALAFAHVVPRGCTRAALQGRHADSHATTPTRSRNAELHSSVVVRDGRAGGVLMAGVSRGGGSAGGRSEVGVRGGGAGSWVGGSVWAR